MKSWNWRIVEFDASRHEAIARLFGAQTHKWMTDCRKKGCGRQAECFVAYDYVSGARGNVSRNEKPFCREHAQEIIDSKRGLQ